MIILWEGEEEESPLCLPSLFTAINFRPSKPIEEEKSLLIVWEGDEKEKEEEKSV